MCYLSIFRCHGVYCGVSTDPATQSHSHSTPFTSLLKSTCSVIFWSLVDGQNMADKVCDYFPHIFKPTRNYEDILGGFFEADHFAQLAVSNLLPQQCKSFSKVSLSASCQNLDERACLCYCLAPVNFFTHALITLALGQYTRDVKEAMEKLGNYIEAGNLPELR